MVYAAKTSNFIFKSPDNDRSQSFPIFPTYFVVFFYGIAALSFDFVTHVITYGNIYIKLRTVVLCFFLTMFEALLYFGLQYGAITAKIMV